MERERERERERESRVAKETKNGTIQSVSRYSLVDSFRFKSETKHHFATSVER